MKPDLLHPQFDKKIPFSIEAESRVIGVIMCYPHLLSQIHFLKSDDFHSKPMSDIYSAILKAHTSGVAFTPFTLPAYIEDIEVYKPLGGIQKYLAQILAMGNSVIEPIEYAKYVHELAQKRRIMEICENIIDGICRENDENNSSQHAAILRDTLERIEQTGQMELFVDNHEVTQEIINEIKMAVMPFSTGIPVLDEAMGGGIHPRKTYGFTARKKVGKTSLAATISANLNAQGINHLFIAAEMSPVEIQQRILSRYMSTYTSAFRSKYGKSDDFNNKLQQAMVMMPKSTFFYQAAGITFQSLRRAVSVAVERKKCKGFILDYWQLVGGKQKGQTTAEHLDEVAQWIANYCRPKGIFSIIIGQMNQDGNTRGSEGLRLACDMCFELRREDLNQPQAWLEMMETRYTKWQNVGSEIVPGLMMNEHGQFFEPFS